jgi:hypothetical protein
LSYLDRRGIDAKPALFEAGLSRRQLSREDIGLSVASQYRFLHFDADAAHAREHTSAAAKSYPKFLKAHRRLVRVLPHDPPADAADKPDDTDDQDKQAQRPFQSVGRKSVEHQDKPDRYKT